MIIEETVYLKSVPGQIISSKPTQEKEFCGKYYKLLRVEPVKGGIKYIWKRKFWKNFAIKREL